MFENKLIRTQNFGLITAISNQYFTISSIPVDLLQMLEFNIPVRFPAAPLLTVILALVGKYLLLYHTLKRNYILPNATHNMIAIDPRHHFSPSFHGNSEKCFPYSTCACVMACADTDGNGRTDEPIFTQLHFITWNMDSLIPRQFVNTIIAQVCLCVDRLIAPCGLCADWWVMMVMSQG